MAAILLASSVPNLDSEQTGLSDKTLHFWTYGALGALMLRALARASWRGTAVRSALGAWTLTSAWGALDEVHQALVPGRFPSWADWLADALGAAAAVGLGLVLARRRRENRAV